MTARQDLGCVHIHISTRPGTCIRVPVTKHSFASIWMVAVHTDTSTVRVRVTCEFHSYEQFLDRSCIQPVRCKQNKICINLITHILRPKLCHCYHWQRCMISKIIKDVVEYCYNFAKHSLDSIFLEIVGRHMLSCPCTIDHERSTHTGEACTSCNPKPGLGTRIKVNVALSYAANVLPAHWHGSVCHIYWDGISNALISIWTNFRWRNPWNRMGHPIDFVSDTRVLSFSRTENLIFFVKLEKNTIAPIGKI